MRPTGASAKFGARLVHRKSLDLELALKPPQNVTDVITIVSFNQRQQRPGRLDAPVRRQ
jgi:hypothetical protein